MITVIVTALDAEARPIADALALERTQRPSPFTLYANEGCFLVVTGPGRVRAAAGCGWVGAEVADKSLEGGRSVISWINVGICGHARQDAGHMIRPAVIYEEASKKSFFPPNIYLSKLDSDRIVTVDVPEREFRDDAAYDMEASAFWQIATRFSPAELITCLKVVSDGPATNIETLTRARVMNLTAETIPQLNEAKEALMAYASVIESTSTLPAVYFEWIDRWRFSVSSRRRLQQYVISLVAYRAPLDTVNDALKNCRNAREVLAALDSCLSAMPVRIAERHSGEATHG